MIYGPSKSQKKTKQKTKKKKKNIKNNKNAADLYSYWFVFFDRVTAVFYLEFLTKLVFEIATTSSVGFYWKFPKPVISKQVHMHLDFYTPPHNSGGVLWSHVGRPCVVRPSVRFSFPDDNLSKHQWIFTKLGMCIDIVEIWFVIATGQISSIFDGVNCSRHAHILVSGL